MTTPVSPIACDRSAKRKPIAGVGAKEIDYESILEGMCNAFMIVQPLGSWREVDVNDDWALGTSLPWNPNP